MAPHRTDSEVSTLNDQGGQDRILLVCVRHSLDKAVCELKQDMTPPSARASVLPSSPTFGPGRQTGTG